MSRTLGQRLFRTLCALITFFLSAFFLDSLLPYSEECELTQVGLGRKKQRQNFSVFQGFQTFILR